MAIMIRPLGTSTGFCTPWRKPCERCRAVNGATLPFLVEEWWEALAHVRELGDILPADQEEQAVRAWVRT